MAPPVSNRPPAAATARTNNTQQATEAEKTQAWQGVLDGAVNRLNAPDVVGTLSHLGEGRIDKIKDQVKEEMEAFVRANPNATPEQIKEKAEEVTSKHQTNGVLEKMRDDNFFKKLMDRRKELLKDMWG
ncbi:hypothetical protein HPC49_32210 [Pyxidicoccus fallax]|uniref:Uncharacterized protein n=1 Tax=Pyxidicoccus fallax TaxID=394095 RepID=A0A848LUZ5_9BACT|nr:hypothetical protein [Pyxidicoccus fallax]NMO21606.1 hypothetical protein [Pyxidicoccus fallax]NPC82876.1 hypothetical protein [Pyxidicoccus fallax]